MMNLFEKLPESVEIGGKSYSINTDFRYGFKAESILTDPDRSNESKVRAIINLYFPVQPPDEHIAETVNKIIWFYTGKDRIEKAQNDDTERERPSRHFSYEFDSGLIFSAFLEQYHMDLTESNLHWWKFKAMFNSLNEDCQFIKVVRIRATEITSKMSKEQKDYYRKMKKLYALPVSNEEQRKIDFVTQALLNGEDLEGITERYYAKYST